MIVFDEQLYWSTYLIEIIGLKDGAGHDTLSGSSLDNDIDTTEEDVLSGGDGGSVALLLNLEVSTLAIISQRGAISRVEGIASTLGEIAGNGTTESRVSRAGWILLADGIFI